MLNIFKKKSVGEIGVGENIPKVFIFLGRSGCGKGTQADLLRDFLSKNKSKSFRVLHIESGAFLREFVKSSGYTQTKVDNVMKNGALVPESMVVALWTNYLIANFTGKEDMVFDGTPRKLHEAQLLDNALKFYDIEKPNVICLNVSREWSEKRLIARGRGQDDKPESIQRRLDWFENEVTKSLDFYRNSPYYNFIDINGEQPIEDVQNEILSKLGFNL